MRKKIKPHNEANLIFKAAKKDVNFMTPIVVYRIMRGEYAVELSEGTGFNHDPIWGVTILKRGETDFDPRSACYHDRDKAIQAINQIR